MNQPAQKIDGWLVDENGAGCIGDMDRAIHIDGDSLVVETVGATSDDNVQATARIPLTVVRAVLGWPNTHDLTPSEVALAKIVAAWEAWREVGNLRHGGQSMIAIESTLIALGYVLPGSREMVLTTAGVALLDRARKAGIL
jgi:hypothetical protein